MVEVYQLNTNEFLAFCHDDSDRGGTVIASSPWVKGRGEIPHSIVLRDLGATFVVHRQITDAERGYAYFENGNYFGKSDDDALARAWACFSKRAATNLGIENPSEN